MSKVTTPHLRKRKPSRESDQFGGLSEQEVRSSIAFWHRQPVVIIAHIVVLPILLVFLWGLREPTRSAIWSFTALAYASYVYLRGWIPWRMPVYQMAVGRPDESERGHAELTTAAFINALPRRATAAALTATAALTPWIMYAVTLMFDLRPIGRGTETTLPLWVFAVLGLGDAIRAGTLAIRFWTRSVMRHWKDLAA